MVDKIMTIQKGKLGYDIGHLVARDLVRFNQAMFIFLGVAE
jgi:hypothetical protein